jgi:hypothetical protein
MKRHISASTNPFQSRRTHPKVDRSTAPKAQKQNFSGVFSINPAMAGHSLNGKANP